jgi:hypothetical protein
MSMPVFMQKPWRFVKHFWECFVIVQKHFFSFWRWLNLLLPIALVAVPWFVSALKQYAWWLCIIGIIWFLVRAFWHSFELYDELNEKIKPRLELSNGIPVPPYRGKDWPNMLYPIHIKNISSSDVEECMVTLIRIVHQQTNLGGTGRLI